MKIKNIIFDWSGTLSDDLTPVYKAAMNVFKILGIKVLSLEEYKKEFILPYMEFYKKFKENVDKEEVDKLFFEEINSVGEPKPFPEAREILDCLHKKGIKIVVLSSHPQKKLEKEMENYEFRRYFLDIVGSVHDKTKTIIEIIKRDKFNPKETIYVGDMGHDIEAGKKAKVKTIAVCWGYKTKEDLKKAKPDFIFENFDEFKKSLERK